MRDKGFQYKRLWGGVTLPLLLTLVSSCGGDDATSTCTALNAGTSWSPSVSGVSTSNRDGNVVISNQTLTSGLTGKTVFGAGQGVPVASEVPVTFSVGSVGATGSITLVAKTKNFTEQGGVYPMLVSLHDGTNELIGMTRTGSGGDCVASGYFTCGSSCTTNNSCTVASTSAYESRRQWEQNQISIFGFSSTNTFPTCNWAGGTNGNGQCDFNGSFLSGGTLRSGNYTARYALVASHFSTISGATADLEVTVVQKTDATAASGAMDLNVILVGTNNINASRTDKGQQNLNALFTHVVNHYNQSSPNIKIGQINTLEWTCEAGGDTYANADITALGNMFEQGSKLVPTSTQGQAMNIFIVSSLSATGSNATILGLAGGIGGPAINGLGSSGLAFSSFDKLATFNPNCGASCEQSSQEASFIDMGATISHELGHYLGLNHPSEKDGTLHDHLQDTPECPKDSSLGFVTHSSCGTGQLGDPVAGSNCTTACTTAAGGSYSPSAGRFCPATSECQYNHTMWWTTKNIQTGTTNADGNIFSPHSSIILNYSPFIQ